MKDESSQKQEEEQSAMNEQLSIRRKGEDSPSDSSFLLPPSSLLKDTFGRVHNNLRISVTDRCNLRCVYCMPEEVVFMDRAELLSFEEIAHFVRVAVPLGIDKIRLTGGEPLMRRDLHKLVRMLV